VGCEIKANEGGGRGQQIEKRVVDLYIAWTEVEGSSHTCTKGHHSKLGFLRFSAHISILYILYGNVLTLYFFLL
jgi:hypothetical protein